MDSLSLRSHGLFCVVLALAMSAAVALAAGPQGVNLASLDDWDIVVAPDAIASEIYAAQEFQALLEEAGGAKLPIVNKASQPNRHVFVGPGSAMRSSTVGFDVAEFGSEDLRIVVANNNIAIAGGRPRGTLYGVYTFCEDYLGVRFLAADHTYVPKLGHWRQIAPVDRFYHPPMDYRWVAYESNYARPDFATRLRLNAARLPVLAVDNKDGRGAGKYGGRTSMRYIGHSFNRQIPPATYAKDHPEYYCLFKGQRWANAKPGEIEDRDFKGGQFPYGMQPCLTNPNVQRIITSSVLDELAAKPDMFSVSVAQNDGGAHCQCPACAAIDAREGTKMGALLTFVNTVADEVAREFPDRMVGTLAYSDTADPPKTLRPRDNVQIMWCSIGTCFIHAFDELGCQQNEWFNRQLLKWSQIAKHLYVWNYHFNSENHSHQLPLPNLRLLEHNIRYQVSLGVRGMFMQATSSSHGNEWEDLRNYMLSNLMWDPARDGRQLMNEWLDLHYGPAAPPIKQWIDRLHERSVASGKHCRCLGGKYVDYGLDESDAQAGLEAIEKAMRLAGDDKAVRNRVEKVSIYAYRAALEPVWYIEEGETVDPALAQRMSPLARHFFDLCRRHGAKRTAEGSHHTMDKIEKRLSKILGLETG